MPKVRKWLKKRRFQTTLAIKNVAPNEQLVGAKYQFDAVSELHLVPYDESLLERSRLQWQFGDWESLAKLDRDRLRHHPDRAKLALLAAAGHLQQGDSQAARQFTRLAQDWGCSKKLISQILISGVHNSLGRAAAISGQARLAFEHFHSSIEAGAANSAVRLLTEARVNKQLYQLGLPPGVLQVQGALQTSSTRYRAIVPTVLQCDRLRPTC